MGFSWPRSRREEGAEKELALGGSAPVPPAEEEAVRIMLQTNHSLMANPFAATASG